MAEDEDIDRDLDEDPDEDTGDSDADDSGSADKKASASKEDELRREARKWRIKLRDQRTAAEKLAAELEELRGKDKSDAEKLSAEVETLRKRADAAEQRSQELILQNAVLTDSSYRWSDPETVLLLLEKAVKRGDVTIDEDGDVDGLSDWMKSTAKNKPHLLQKPDSEGDPEDGGKKTNGSAPPPPKAGTPASGRKKDGTQGFSEEDLLRKFPALRRG